MAQQDIDYSVANDFGGAVNTSTLHGEIVADPGITIQLVNVGVDPDSQNPDPDLLRLTFAASLPAAEKTVLDEDKGHLQNAQAAGGLIAAHDSTPTPGRMEVELVGLATTFADNGEAVLAAAPQPARPGYRMCDRDIKLFTAKVGAASCEDFRVNVSNSKQEDWGEMTLVGCYKDSDPPNETYVVCADQTDADSNACLSVWDYQAEDPANPGTKIEYELRGGLLYVDAALAADKAKHRLYAVAAPDIPANLGGAMRFFDSYLEPMEGGCIEALNAAAFHLNPSPAPGATVLRIYVYYPAGAAQTHILRLVTYRPTGMF